MPLNISKFGVPAQSCFGTNTYTDSGVFSISIKLNVGKIVLSKFQNKCYSRLSKMSVYFLLFSPFFSPVLSKSGEGQPLRTWSYQPVFLKRFGTQKTC